MADEHFVVDLFSTVKVSMSELEQHVRGACDGRNVTGEA